LLSAGLDENALRAFECLFGIVAAAPRRSVEIFCPCRQTLGRDEGRLLQLISLLQRARHSEGEAILDDWLPPAAGRMAIGPALDLAGSLARERLIVPWRHPEAARLAHAEMAHANRRLAPMQ
jgi:hypothetical protein